MERLGLCLGVMQSHVTRVAYAERACTPPLVVQLRVRARWQPRRWRMVWRVVA